MKLELKHLAPYLPYGLKRHCPSSNVMIHDYTAMEFTQETCDRHQSYGWKPILRPLSDLTEIFYWDNLQDGDCELDRERINEIKNSPRGHLKLYQSNYLFKHHFDIFGLIEKSLAIDINTLSVQNDG